MRSVRVRRRSYFDLRRITIGDWIMFVAGAMTVVSLFLPWFVTSVPTTSAPHPHGEWAFTYSEWASVIVIVFFLVTLFLVIYPAISPDLGLPPLPFSPPLIFFTMGAILLLVFTYQLGKYACILCTGTSRGYGIWIGLISSGVYILGAVIRWGSRPVRRD
jgi:hypothetical protein